MNTPNPSAAEPRDRLDWRGRIAAYGLSVVAVGIAINLASEHGLPALTAATGVPAVFGIAWWLGRYPGSALQKTVRIVLWSLAATATVLAATQPGRPAVWLTLAATGLLAITVLLTTSLTTAVALLGGATGIGVGIALTMVGVAVLLEGVLAGAVIAGMGGALLIAAAGLLQGRAALFGAALGGVGVAGITLGVGLLLAGAALFGAALAGAGVALVVFGVGLLRGGTAMSGAALTGLGVAVAVFGVTWLQSGDVLAGVAFIGRGVAIIVAAAAWLRAVRCCSARRASGAVSRFSWPGWPGCAAATCCSGCCWPVSVLRPSDMG